MRLTVLGSGPAVPHPGGASSGYLVESGSTRVLLDCGHGISGNLRRHLDLGDLTAIVVSHMHPDHLFDLVALHYGLKYRSRTPGGPEPRPIPLYLPPAGGAIIASVMQPIIDVSREGGSGATFFKGVFELAEYDPATAIRIGELTLRFAEVQHYVPCWAVAVENASGARKLAYSADTGPCEGLDTIARGAELFLCEATHPTDRRQEGFRGHLTTAEAAAVAQRAGVGRLVLTHIWRERPADSVPEAQAVFGGPVDLAEEHRVFEW